MKALPAPSFPGRRTVRILGAAALLLAAALGMHARAAAPVDAAHASHVVRLPDSVARSVARYPIPGVTLTRADGHPVSFADALADGRPVVLNFVYTTCTTICSVGSQTFAEVQRRLGAARDRVHLVSVSIDPEEDTPQRLSDYSRRYDAGPQWDFYTGTLEASLDVQRAFRVYRGNKSDHSPVTLVRRTPGGDWVRLDGFATAPEILAELPGVAAAN